MQIPNFEQWLKNHKDKQQTYINNGQYADAIKICYLCCEELLQKQHHFKNEENAQAIDFFCIQLSVLGEKESKSLIQIETKRQLYRASAAFQQLCRAIAPVSDLSNEQLLLQLKKAYIDFFSIINKEWLLLLNNSAYRQTMFSGEPYQLSSDLQLFAHLRFLAAILEQYTNHHAQLAELITLEANKDLALQLKLCKSYIYRFLSSIHDHLVQNTQDLAKLSADNALLLMKLNLDTTEILDKQYRGNVKNNILYCKFLSANICMNNNNFTQKAEDILRQGYQRTLQTVTASAPQVINLNKSAFGERLSKTGCELTVVSSANASDIILNELQVNRNYIEAEHTQFIQRLQNELQNSEHNAWVNKTTHADLYLYFINSVTLIRFYLSRNDFALASKTIKAMEIKMQAVLPDQDAYFTAFVAFNPRYPLLQEYCFAMTAAADNYFDILSKRLNLLNLCLRDKFNCSLNECVLKLPQLILLTYLHINESRIDSAQEHLYLLIEKIVKLLRLTEQDFQGMPVDIVSQQDINKLYFIAIDSLMKWILKKANKMSDFETKRQLHHFAQLLAVAAEAFLPLKYLEEVCQKRGTQLTIAKSKFFNHFHYQECSDSEEFEKLYQKIRQSNEHVFKALLNPVDQFELLITEVLYIYHSVTVLEEANSKQNALKQHLLDLKHLFEAHITLNSQKRYQILFHFVGNLCFFSGSPDYNEVIKHSHAALQIFGHPSQLKSSFDHKYFYSSSIDLINAHIGLISVVSGTEKEPVDITRTLLLRLFTCLEESWFFSTDYKILRDRLLPYKKTKDLIKVFANLVDICMDTLLHINIFAIQNHSDLLFTEQVYRDFATKMTTYINHLHTFAFHELQNGKMFSLNTYTQLARLHVYVLLLCDAQHPALLRINELQTFCDNDLIKSKNPTLNTEAIEGLSLTLADLNIQLTMLTRHPFLSDRKNLLPVLAFIDTISNGSASIQDKATKPLTNIPLQFLESVKIPALQLYCRFVYALAVAKHYFNRQDKSNFITAFKSLQSDTIEIANLILKDLRYHFYTFLQPQLMRDYLIIRSYAYLLENQYALAAACIDTLKVISSEPYVFDELAGIYDLEKMEEEQYLQDNLSQLICMVQNLRITLEYESPHRTLEVFIQQNQSVHPSHSENAACRLWQQLPILDKSTQPIDKSSAQKLLPFIDECLISFNIACTAYLRTDVKKSKKEELLNISHLKQTYEVLLSYLSQEQDENFKKLIKKIEQNIKERKSKKANSNISVNISTDFSEDTSITAGPAVSAAAPTTTALSSALKNRPNIDLPLMPTQQHTQTHALENASAKNITRIPSVSSKSSSIASPSTGKRSAVSRGKHLLNAKNKLNSSSKSMQAAAGNKQRYEATAVASVSLAKPLARPAPSPNAAHLNSTTRILQLSSPIFAKQPATPIITSNNHTPVKLAANTTLSDLTQAIYAATGKMPSYAAVTKGLTKKAPIAVAADISCQRSTSDKLETTELSAQAITTGNPQNINQPQICTDQAPITCDETKLKSHETKLNSDQISIQVQNTSIINSQSASSVNKQSSKPVATETLESLQLTAQTAQKNLAHWSVEYNNIITLYNAYTIELGYHHIALNVHLEVLDILGYRLQYSELQNCYYLQKIKLPCIDLSKPLPLTQVKAANELSQSTTKGSALLLSCTDQLKEMPLPNNPMQLSTYCSQAQALTVQLCNETQNAYRSHENLVTDLNHKNRLLKTCIEALQVISLQGTHYEIQFNRDEAKSYLIARKPCELTKSPANC